MPGYVPAPGKTGMVTKVEENPPITAIQEVIDALNMEGLTRNVACILFYAIVGFRNVINDMNQQLQGKAVVQAYRQLGEANQAFDPEAGIFSNEEERKHIYWWRP